MIYYYPCWFYILPEYESFDCMSAYENTSVSMASNTQLNQFHSTLKESEQKFMKIFQNELKLKKQNKKVWSASEDDLLLKMRDSGKDWIEISEQIQGANPEKCKRRFQRIKAEGKRWPKQVDEAITRLYEQEGCSWPLIVSILNKNMDRRTQLNSKQVKERYLFHLKPGISHEQWSIAEDLLLLKLAREKGNMWKVIAQSFHNRTELQLKNRYYGTLKFIQKRVLQKLCHKNSLTN